MYLHSESKLLPHLSVLPAPLVYKWEQTLATTAGKSKGEKISITVTLGSFLGVEARREEQHTCWQPAFLLSVGSEGLVHSYMLSEIHQVFSPKKNKTLAVMLSLP